MRIATMEKLQPVCHVNDAIMNDSDILWDIVRQVIRELKCLIGCRSYSTSTCWY